LALEFLKNIVEGLISARQLFPRGVPRHVIALAAVRLMHCYGSRETSQPNQDP
jgi:hypothetical protein